jgi:serine/threonine protein kinase/tetratricopeptide (TPR) repeat protein
MSSNPSPLEEIFFAALEKSSAQERTSYLEEACAGDADLRRQVEKMLAAQTQLSGFLESPAAGKLAATVDEPPGIESPGAVIGPYRLLECIGEGGFGVVYMAEQSQPVRRRVALKVLKPGMDSRQVIARFEAERQALAIMDHPNIAKVYDGGATPLGRPYFVMELVKGVPITDFCDQRHLTPRQRMELFLPVCHALQHAHQKGIIHRDLKPSNILVVMHDTTPVPKVIDFGVAKAMGQELTDKTLFTAFSQMIGTPLYMSPEQAGQSGLDIDTRTDIYSLGVLLYELLTGTTPFTRERFEQAAYDEIRRIIREEDPPRPSTRLADSKDTLPSISAQRDTEPAKLTRLLRGELDWIVMKALEKDRNRRYETANGFAMDLERYLRDEPVLACPPSAGYRLRKFARRHRRPLIAAAAFVILLLSAVAMLTIAVFEINRQRQQKVAALEAEAKRRKQTREALDAMTSQVIEDRLAKQPVLLPEHKQFLEQTLRYYEEFAVDTGQDEESRSGVAGAFHRVGFIRERLGQFKDAEAAYERSRDLWARLVADFPGKPIHRHHLSAALVTLGTLHRHMGRPREAETLLTQSVAIQRQLARDYANVHNYRYDLARQLTSLGILLKDLGRLDDAEAVYAESVAIHDQLAAELPSDPKFRDALGQAHGNFGLLLSYARRSREAEESIARGAAIYRKLADDYPTVPRYRDEFATCCNNLGDEVRHAGRHVEAEKIFQDALAIRRQLVQEFPVVPEYRRGLAIVLNNLGILYKDTGRVAEAADLYGQALAVHKRLAADYPAIANSQNETAGAMVNVARLLLARKDVVGARRLLEEALPYHQAALKANPRQPQFRNFYRLNRWRMAETLLELKDHAAAAEAVSQFLQVAYELPRDAYNSACLLARCSRLAATDERFAETKRNELASDYGDRALAALRQAIEKGYKDIAQLNKDADLELLRSRADFQKLMADLGAPLHEPERPPGATPPASPRPAGR